MIWLHFLVISPGTQEQWEPSTIFFPYFKGFLSEWELGVVLVWEWGSDLLGYLEFPLDFLLRFVISSSCEQRWAATGTEDLHKITHRKRHQWCVIEPLKKCSLARTYMCAGFHLTPFLCPKCSRYSVGSSPLGIGGCFDIGGCSLPNKGACTTWRFHMEYFFLYTFFGPTMTYPDNHRASAMTILPRQTILHGTGKNHFFMTCLRTCVQEMRCFARETPLEIHELHINACFIENPWNHDDINIRRLKIGNAVHKYMICIDSDIRIKV